jgi:hypothetical protein
VLRIFTDYVNEAADDNGPFATNHVCEVTSDECAKESTTRENRDDERRVATADSASAFWSVKTLWADRALDFLDEKGGVEHAVDITRIITC